MLHWDQEIGGMITVVVVVVECLLRVAVVVVVVVGAISDALLVDVVDAYVDYQDHEEHHFVVADELAVVVVVVVVVAAAAVVVAIGDALLVDAVAFVVGDEWHWDFGIVVVVVDDVDDY